MAINSGEFSWTRAYGPSERKEIISAKASECLTYQKLAATSPTDYPTGLESTDPASSKSQSESCIVMKSGKFQTSAELTSTGIVPDNPIFTTDDKISSVNGIKDLQFRHFACWEKIPDYPRYWISEDGRVVSFASGKPLLMKATVSSGYRMVGLCGNGRAGTYQDKFHVHSLVAKIFIGPRPEGMEVDHKDGNKLNNHVSNLAYLTPSRNIRGAVSRGHRGSNRWNSRLTEDEVREIRDLRAHGMDVGEIASVFDLSKGAIWHIVLRHNWKHIE